MLRIRTLHPDLPEDVGLVWPAVYIVAAMKNLADLHAALKQIFARSLDVTDDQIKPQRRARSRVRHILAEDDRAPRTRWRELNHAKVLAVLEVGVQPPTKLRIELLRAIRIRDRNHNDLELHVDPRRTRPTGNVVRLNFNRICHVLFSFAFNSIEPWRLDLGATRLSST